MTIRFFIKQQVELYLRVFYMLQQDDDHLLLSKEDAIVKALQDLSFKKRKKCIPKEYVTLFLKLSDRRNAKHIYFTPVYGSLPRGSINSFHTISINDKMIVSTKDDLFAGKMHALVYEDASPFLRNPKELDIWSNDYFVQLAGMVRIE